jgi:hypothetical protein
MNTDKHGLRKSFIRVHPCSSVVYLLFQLLLSIGADAEQTLRSRSGQFLVTGLPATPRFASYSITNRVDYVRLDPAVLAVSCERVKEALLDELDMADAWQSPLNIRIFPVRHDNEPVRFTSIRYRDAWSYALEVPEWVPRARLVTAVVQAVLGEIANRRSQERAAELPTWLLEGLTTYLLANNPDGLILEPATRTMKRHAAAQSLAPVREALRAHSALTLDQLSWPKEEPDIVYTHCAHLFVHELLELRGGRRSMAQMVWRLGEHYNWQTTFLTAFSPHFHRLVDLDKWWALSVAHVTGRDPMSLWPLEQALAHLDQILATPMQVRLKTSGLPGTTQVSLQNIMAEWEDKRQEPLIAQKISLLQALRLRAPPEALEAIDGYMLTLQSRLRGRLNKADTIRRLNDLDAQRMKLSPPQAAQVDR